MRSGLVGLVGLPNAGKSTLVNALVGEKVAIVSHKPQTTRKRVLGILNSEDAQIVFIDTPGKVKDQRGLNSYLKKELSSVMLESDVLVAVLNVDVARPDQLFAIIEEVKNAGKPWMAVITKDDLPHPQRTIALRARLQDEGVPVVAVSVLKRTEISKELILPLIIGMLPPVEDALYPKEMYTTQTEREMVAEIVREKCFHYLHEELPFGLATKMMEFDESRNITQCSVDIIVSRPNHVSIVVGKGGQNLKKIGMTAREECEKILGRPIVLKTFVKCVEQWTNNPQRMQEFGYAD